MLKDLLKFIAVPLTLIIVFTIFAIIYEILGLPPSSELIAIAKHYFDTYGYVVVFIAALVEGLLVVNWYLPGLAVILFGITFAHDGPLRPEIVVSLVMLGFFVTSVANYVIGRLAWHRFFYFLGLAGPLEHIRNRVERHGLSVIFSTYFHPNLGALTATSAGVLELPFRRFAVLSFVAIVLWYTAWGIIVYLAGPYILKLATIRVFVAILLIWLLVATIHFLRSRRNNSSALRTGSRPPRRAG